MKYNSISGIHLILPHPPSEEYISRYIDLMDMTINIYTDEGVNEIPVKDLILKLLEKEV